MNDIVLTNHAEKRARFFSKLMSWEEVLDSLKKMGHNKEGEHWILVKKFKKMRVVNRWDGKANGERLIVVVCPEAEKKIIKTFLLRRNKQANNGDYYWS